MKVMKPKRYRAQYIEPGIVSYEDVGDGKVFVSKDALDQMQGSFVGAPVINRMHKDLSAEEAFDRRNEDPESWADGIITATGYNEDTGWYWADMLIWDEDTMSNIKNGYSVSCSYIPGKTAGPGSYHGIDYDEEVIDGQYTHMAIVDNPRYEGSIIYENSKKGNKQMKFKLFNNQKPKDNAAEDVEEMDVETAVFEDENGDTIPMNELMAAYRAQKENTSQRMNMDDEVEVDGEMVPVKALYEAYKSKDNVEPEDDGPMDNAEPPQDEAMEPVVEKQNMKKVRTAAQSEGEVDRSEIETRGDRIDRGKSRYTRKVPQGGAK